MDFPWDIKIFVVGGNVSGLQKMFGKNFDFNWKLKVITEYWETADGAHGGNELSSRADQNVMRLYRDLLYDYNNEVRPSVHSKEPINVTFVFSLTQIIDVVSFF